MESGRREEIGGEGRKQNTGRRREEAWMREEKAEGSKEEDGGQGEGWEG